MLRQTLHFETFITQMSDGRPLFDETASSPPAAAAAPIATLRIAFWLDDTGCAGHMLLLTCAEDVPGSEHAAWEAMRAEQAVPIQEAQTPSRAGETDETDEGTQK